jgi:hypothetical protein
MDAINTSMCVWPLISPPVYLKRLDIFENTSKLCHFGTTTVTESRKIRFDAVITRLLSDSCHLLSDILVISFLSCP